MGRWGEGQGLIDQIRSTIRRLRGSPGYTASAIGVLGLGLGVLFATTTVLYQGVLQPLPVLNQDRVVVAWTNHVARSAPHYPVNTQLFELAESGGLGALSKVAAVSSGGTRDVVLDTEGGPRPVAWARVLGDFFGVLGVQPRLGRTLRLDDDVPGPPTQAVVISDGLWDRLYGRSPDVLNETLRTRYGTFRIVGVAPAAFDYPPGAEIWAPTRAAYPDWDSERPRLELDLVGRMQPGASRDQVAAQLSTLAGSTTDLAGIYEGTAPVVLPFDQHVRGDLKPVLWMLFGAGVLVLLVGCLDVANLVLVRGTADRRRAALQLALGLPRSGLMAEVAIEALVLGLGAAALAALVGTAGVRLLIPLVPDAVRGLHVIGGVGWTSTLAFAFVALAAAASAIGAPRWAVASAAPESGVYRSAAPTESPKGRRFREAAVTGQVALAAWVLITGILLVRTVSNLTALEPGFEPDHLAIVQLNRDGQGGVPLAPPGDALDIARVVAELEATPGIVGATPVQMAPLPGNAAWQTILFKEGQSEQQALDENAYVFMEFVDPGFESVLGVPVVQGRSFTASDDQDAASVLVVNRAAAELYWPGESAIGQRIAGRLPGLTERTLTVVGVVANTRYGALTEFKPTAYYPYRQTGMFRVEHLLLRTNGNPTGVFEIVRSALARNAPQFEAVRIESIQEQLDQPVAAPRFAATLVMALALTALVLALAGVYATMTFSVQARTRELGIRLACGGTPGHVGGLVVRRGLALAAAGSIVGVVAAAGSGGLFRRILFGVEPTSMTPLLLGAALASAFTLLACLPAARRAAATEPASVLKAD